MARQFTGGCLCGRVRYECSADPIFMGNCHCRDCQKASGGAYEPDIGLPAAALKITGPVKYYDTKADSGNMLSRGFSGVRCEFIRQDQRSAGPRDDHRWESR
jgi:hypothetical protein